MTSTRPVDPSHTESRRRLLQDRVVIVFGGGSATGKLNNGLAASVAYARAGASVAIVDRDAGAAETGAQHIRLDVPGARVIAIAADITQNADVRSAFDRTEAELGGIDVLHNNVGRVVLGGALEVSEADWHSAFAINVDGAFRTVREALPRLVARGGGAIVNVSSTASLRYTGYDYPAYAASKAALNQFTVSVALEYADRHIRANVVAPGLIETPLIETQILGSADQLQATLEARHRTSPTGRMGRAEDVANVAVFLASPMAAYVNGVVLPVDGGLTASCPPVRS